MTKLSSTIWQINSLLLLFSLQIYNCHNLADGSDPEQIHLSVGDNGFDVVITWSTLMYTGESIVRYGVVDLDSEAEGTFNFFIDGGRKKRRQEIHRVVLSDLTPNTIYKYQCGSNIGGWSSVYSFKTFSKESQWAPSFAFFGDVDFDYSKEYTIPFLYTDVTRRRYDIVWHLGDIAYALDSNDGKKGDKFMNKVEPIAARVPYMVTPGNHEREYNFSHYRHRFTMPGNNQGLYYSINIGPVHFLAYSSEIYYGNENEAYTLSSVRSQYRWIMNDLRIAQNNRGNQPWIIAVSHRPMYCTNVNRISDDCRRDMKTRVGLKIKRRRSKRYGLEKLFQLYGVDLHIAAHTHTYEKIYPIYNYTLRYSNRRNPFENPNAPIHIVASSAMYPLIYNDLVKPKPRLSAFRSQSFGYTRIKIYNRTHCHLEQVTIRKRAMGRSRRKVIDRTWIIQTYHTGFET